MNTNTTNPPTDATNVLPPTTPLEFPWYGANYLTPEDAILGCAALFATMYDVRTTLSEAFTADDLKAATAARLRPWVEFVQQIPVQSLPKSKVN